MYYPQPPKHPRPGSHPVLLLIGLALLCLVASSQCSCRSSRSASVPNTVQLLSRDTVSLTIRERVRIDTVRLEVPVPQSSVYTATPDTCSLLENEVAISRAWLCSGLLHHTLQTKPVTLPATALHPVAMTDTARVSEKYREIPVPQPYPVEVEKPLTLLQRIALPIGYTVLATASLALLLLLIRLIRLKFF